MAIKLTQKVFYVYRRINSPVQADLDLYLLICLAKIRAQIGCRETYKLIENTSVQRRKFLKGRMFVLHV